MAWVQMMESISGGRPGGGPWPPAGYLLECEDWEAASLIKSRVAVAHPPPANATPPAPPPPPPAPPPAPQAPAAEEPVPEPEPPAPTEPEPAAVADETAEEPAPSDSKQTWVDYAVSQGANPGDAAALTKAQLQAAYGGRL